jgi:5'-nucleotidase
VLTGAGFAPHETVFGYWASTSSAPFTVTATTNSLGTFGGSASAPGITFTVPLSPTGSYAVYAVGQSSHGVAHASFTLVPHLNVTPGSALPGALVKVAGSGYGAHESVALKYDCATSGCSSSTVLATPTTDGNGAFSVTVTLPGTASVGTHSIGGKGSTSGVFATTSITIT